MENIFQELFCGKESEGSDPLSWATLTLEEKKVAWRTAKFDIDFVCFCMPGIAFASSAAVENLLARLQGQFRKETYVVKLRTSLFKHAAVICDLHPFKIAVPIGGYVENPSTDEFLAVEPETHFTGHEDLRRELNLLLAEAPKNLCPYRDLKSALRRLFGGHRLCTFLYGQKQSVESFLEDYGRISQEALLFIALGAEVEKPGSMLLCSHEGFNIGNNFYSLALSPNAGCLLVKDEAVCRSILSRAYRFCAYSTVQHLRKDYSYALKITGKRDENVSQTSEEEGPTEGEDTVFCDLLAQAVKRLCQNKRPFEAFFESERLRLEGYFDVALDLNVQGTLVLTVEGRAGLANCIEELEILLEVCFYKHIRIVCEERKQVIMLISSLFDLFERFSIPRFRRQNEYSFLHMFFAVYDLFILGVYGCRSLSKTSLSRLRGLGLPGELYDSDKNLLPFVLVNEVSRLNRFEQYIRGEKHAALCSGAISVCFVRLFFEVVVGMGEYSMKTKEMCVFGQRLKAIIEELFIGVHEEAEKEESVSLTEVLACYCRLHRRSLLKKLLAQKLLELDKAIPEEIEKLLLTARVQVKVRLVRLGLGLGLGLVRVRVS